MIDSPTPARATIVMTARERHSLAEAAIESILSETAAPVRLLYVDVQSPPPLREALDERAAAGTLEVIRFDEPLWPQQARRRVMPRIATEYVVFIDNDVQVESGWLDALIRCADETGAGIVGPLYLIGDGIGRPTIHMAGGVLTRGTCATGTTLAEGHRLAGADPRAVAPSLVRTRCDFVEFHCMLVRTDVLRAANLPDDAIRSVHEHIDLALAVQSAGREVWFEPAARVTYLGLADFMLDDLPFFRTRWTIPVAEADIAAFCRKWNVVDDAGSFDGVRTFVRQHAREVDPVRPGPWAAPQDLPMTASALAQTRSAMLDLAATHGYGDDDLALLSDAYHLAHLLMDGGYRPCGRPFIAHLTGTAGVLIRYGFRTPIVAAGLLHAAYTHSPAHAAGAQAALAAVCATLGGRDSVLERRVRAYTLSGTGTAGAALAPAAALTVGEAEIVAIEAANEVDMHLAGEFRYSGRSDGLSDAAMTRIGGACALLGVPGLHATLVAARAAAASAPGRLLTRQPASYRITPDRRGAARMAVNSVSPLAQGAI
jgi:GT2 family glycosyltransferase